VDGNCIGWIQLIYSLHPPVEHKLLQSNGLCREQLHIISLQISGNNTIMVHYDDLLGLVPTHLHMLCTKPVSTSQYPASTRSSLLLIGDTKTCQETKLEIL